MDFYYLFSIFDKLISFYTLNNNLVRWHFLHSFGNLLIGL